MKIVIRSATEYVGQEGTPINSFDLEVESEGENGVTVSNTYLKLREILLAGLKEEA